MEKFIITISSKGEGIKVEADGFRGKECITMTEFLTRDRDVKVTKTTMKTTVKDSPKILAEARIT